MLRFLVPLFLISTAFVYGDDNTVVFKSDVALTRVDAQVVDGTGRAITGLQASDFVLRVNGKVVPIRNFASENMPVDILLLLDVSGSMQPHVRRIASASTQALNVLADKDRVAIMVFDTSTRVRLPFRSSHSEVTGELNGVLRAEHFSRGTRITHALLDAANYLQREARPEARRAVVVLTDDQTQDDADEGRVGDALAKANAILSFLQAPYEPPTMGGGGGGGRRRGTWGSGGGWPGGGGGGWPGGGGIGFPGRGPGGIGRDQSHSAGTAQIARDSGGDTMQVEDASALEDTLSRLRQRYALHFYLPEGSSASDQRTVQVNLTQLAGARYQDVEVRYRRVNMSGNGSGPSSGPTVVSREQEPVTLDNGDSSRRDQGQSTSQGNTPRRRRVAVNDSTGPSVNTVDSDSSTTNTAEQPETTPIAPSRGGWPKAPPQPSTPSN
jgi:VWFA-related protein